MPITRSCLGSLFILAILTAAAHPSFGAVVTGTVRIPGTSHEVEYTHIVKPDPTDPTRVILRVRIRPINWDGAAYSFLLCAMVQTKFGPLNMPEWGLSAEGGCLTCKRTGTPDHPGTADRRKGWHFGCHRISIAH